VEAEHEQRRKAEAIANTIGIRVLSAIGTAVPVRLLKRDLQFLLSQIAPLLDEWRLQTLARQHGIRKDRDIVAHCTNLIHRTAFWIGQRQVIPAKARNVGAFVAATHGDEQGRIVCKLLGQLLWRGRAEINANIKVRVAEFIRAEGLEKEEA
jgi:hypothetical protein